MKVSLNEIKRLGYGDVVALPVDELVEKIGAQLGAVEEVEDLGAKYKGVVVARVMSCDDHPNADRLHVCKIDDGNVVQGVERDENGYVQVVCGAPNVREELLVAWLPPGSTVPETYHHEAPFVLDARELRGVVSNGMLASARELALSESHEGILEIDTDAQPGQAFAEVYQLDDHIIDIENKMFTHRPDCFGLLGVARELAGIQHKPFTSPDWYVAPRSLESRDTLALNVNNDVMDVVLRFVAIAMQNITVQPSPMWLQTALIRLGSRPINNVVDITNYIMLVTGQPLHAYDYDKVGTHALGVRMAHDGETLALLNGKTATLTDRDVVITNGEKAVGLGGVMGGAETEVDESTTTIILECANFDMYTVRRTSMRHGLFTDAVTRFNKGQSPLQNEQVALKAVEMLREIAHGETASALIDTISQNPKLAEYDADQMGVGADFVNQRLGLTLDVTEMKTLLENVEFIVNIDTNGFLVEAPFWRTDIEIPEDIVEEIGRLYGYDRLPLVLPRRDIAPAKKNQMIELKSQLRSVLSRIGANEVLTYSFVHGGLLDKVGQSREDSFQISNALSPDLQYYRLSVLPSLLDKVHSNIKAGYDELALFEIGKGHYLKDVDGDGLPGESEMLDFVYAAHDKVAQSGAAYYQARYFLEELTTALHIDIEVRPAGAANRPLMQPFDLKRSAFVFVKNTDVMLGIVGELNTSVRAALKLPIHTAAFSLELPQLLTASGEAQSTYAPLSRYPATSQDICLRVGPDTQYSTVASLFERVLRECPYEWKLQPVDIYRADDARQITLRVTLNNPQATLTAADAQRVVESIVAAAAAELNAEYV